MAPYLIFLLLTLLFFSFPVRGRTIYAVSYRYIYPFEAFTWFFIICFSGFRYGIGTDYNGYEYIYYTINSLNEYNEGLELGFAFFTKLFYDYKFGFSALVFFLSLVTNIFFWLGLRYWYNGRQALERFYYLLFFFISNTYFWPFNGIRQGVACAICLFSVRYIERRKLLRFAICIVIAFLFHKSAFIFLPFYFLYRIALPKIIPASIVIFAFLMHIVGGLEALGSMILPYLGDKYARYIYTPPDFGGSGMGVYLYAMMFIVILFFSYMINLNKKEANKGDFLFLLFSLGVALRILALDNIIFVRVAYYFTLYDMIFIPYFIFLFEKSINKILLSIFFVSIYTLLFAMALQYSNDLIPYQNVLFN